ncbi:hypothetical protein M2140_001785 [Clostridiales Family XIII bacterium PM5-7]
MKKYIVTEDIDSPNKVTKNVDVFDFFFVIVYMGVSFAMMSLVNSKFKIVFMIFSLFIAVFLTSRSYFNKRRRNYESIILMLGRDDRVYRPFQQKEENKKDG